MAKGRKRVQRKRRTSIGPKWANRTWETTEDRDETDASSEQVKSGRDTIIVKDEGKVVIDNRKVTIDSKYTTKKATVLEPPTVKRIVCKPDGMHVDVGINWTDLGNIPEGLGMVIPYVPNPYAPTSGRVEAQTEGDDLHLKFSDPGVHIRPGGRLTINGVGEKFRVCQESKQRTACAEASVTSHSESSGCPPGQQMNQQGMCENNSALQETGCGDVGSCEND